MLKCSSSYCNVTAAAMCSCSVVFHALRSFFSSDLLLDSSNVQKPALFTLMTSDYGAGTRPSVRFAPRVNNTNNMPCRVAAIPLFQGDTVQKPLDYVVPGMAQNKQ